MLSIHSVLDIVFEISIQNCGQFSFVVDICWVFSSEITVNGRLFYSAKNIQNFISVNLVK